MISGLVCRGKHNNNSSDSVIVSPLRKYSFWAQLERRWSAEARLLQFRGKRSQ